MADVNYTSSPYPNQPEVAGNPFLTAIGNWGPAEQRAAWMAQQVRQNFLQNMGAERAAVEQNEWMQQGDLRQMQADQKRAEAQLGGMNARNALELGPLQQKNAMETEKNKYVDMQRDQIMKSVNWLAQYGDQLMGQIEGVTDLGEKNMIWREWMDNAANAGLKVDNFRNWSPQAERRVRMLMEKTVMNPQVMSKIKEYEKTTGADNKMKETHQDSRTAATLNQGLELQRMKNASDERVANIREQGEAARASKPTIVQTSSGYDVVFPDGRVNSKTAPTKVAEQRKTRNEEIRGARRLMKEAIESGDQARMLMMGDKVQALAGQLPDYADLDELDADVRAGIVSPEEARGIARYKKWMK